MRLGYFCGGVSTWPGPLWFRQEGVTQSARPRPDSLGRGDLVVYFRSLPRSWDIIFAGNMAAMPIPCNWSWGTMLTHFENPSICLKSCSMALTKYQQDPEENPLLLVSPDKAGCCPRTSDRASLTLSRCCRQRFQCGFFHPHHRCRARRG